MDTAEVLKLELAQVRLRQAAESLRLAAELMGGSSRECHDAKFALRYVECAQKNINQKIRGRWPIKASE